MIRNRYLAFVIAVVIGVGVALVIAGVALASTPFQVYVSATGSDASDGLTPQTAVKTLDRVEEIVAAQVTDVEVRIDQGLYTDNQTSWETYIPGHTITFMPEDYEYGEGYSGIAGRPVFRSDGSAGYWFKAKLPTAHPGGDTGLRFYYLQVERYNYGGVEINGGFATVDGYRVPTGAGANGNLFFGMLFKQLGNKWSTSPLAGWGAVVLSNSSGNVVQNNHFQYLENLGDDYDLIHATYTEHGSNANKILNNSLLYVSGDPIHFRNSANDNDVHHNRLERTSSLAYYGEWFCDGSCVVSGAQECASHGNVFHHNDLVTGYTGNTIPTWHLHPAGINYEGGAACDNEGEPRLSTYSNT
jgi:hypothetical protein